MFHKIADVAGIFGFYSKYGHHHLLHLAGVTAKEHKILRDKDRPINSWRVRMKAPRVNLRINLTCGSLIKISIYHYCKNNSHDNFVAVYKQFITVKYCILTMNL
jgi:hypothetical protein